MGYAVTFNTNLQFARNIITEEERKKSKVKVKTKAAKNHSMTHFIKFGGKVLPKIEVKLRISKYNRTQNERVLATYVMSIPPIPPFTLLLNIPKLNSYYVRGPQTQLGILRPLHSPVREKIVTNTFSFHCICNSIDY